MASMSTSLSVNNDNNSSSNDKDNDGTSSSHEKEPLNGPRGDGDEDGDEDEDEDEDSNKKHQPPSRSQSPSSPGDRQQQDQHDAPPTMKPSSTSDNNNNNNNNNHNHTDAFAPEASDHLSHPNGGFYAGSRKDFPLPKSRYPLPRGSMQRLLEPKPGSEGGRQRHYLDDPSHELQGFWTEDGEWVDWPPKGDGEGVKEEKENEKGEETAEQEAEEEAAETQAEGEAEADAATATPESGGSGGGGGNKDNNIKEKAKEKEKDKDKEESGHAGTVSATVGTRRQANGTIGSVYSGNKIRHLKKDDGIPLWRKDIQYEFLKLVFEDKTPAFTRLSDSKKGMDFADIYIDAMAKSSKTSRILKDKLQNEKQAAISMAMVCLLVNFGRMNTTLNFFPEMRAQLRTYHSIPSLQAHQDPNSYKQLQDAPRLKSILKGASEDTYQPNTIEKISELPVPRTNPVNLIFVLAQYAPKISEVHFFAPRDFFDLVMRATLSSRSRARAFLWLMWWYLESDFTKEAALNNPFGPGLDGEGTGGLPLKVPVFEHLTEEQAGAENEDTPEEIEFGEIKRIERKRILEADEVATRAIKKPKKAGDGSMSDDQMSGDIPCDMSTSSQNGKNDRMSMGGHHEGAGSTASTPLNPLRRPAPDDDDLTPSSTKRSRSKRPKRESSANRASSHQQRLILKTKMDQTPDAVSPAPPGSGHPVLNQYADSPPGHHPAPSRRPRPLTQHQLAVEQNRKERIDYLLAQRRAEAISAFRAYRENEIPYSRTRRLLQSLPDGYDTDDENSWGKGGLCPNPVEEEDYGETAGFYQSVLRKAARRLERWDQVRLPGAGKDLAAKKAEARRQMAYEKENAAAAPAKKPPPKRVRKSRSKAALAAAKEEREAAEAARAAAGIEKEPRSKAAASRSKRASGAAKPATNGHVSSPAPKAADDEDEQLDDIDKELLGELSDDDDDDHAPPAAPAAAPVRDSSPANRSRLQPPAPEADESSFVEGEGEGYASSSEHEDQDHRGDEEMDDVDSSVLPAGDQNGDVAAAGGGNMSDDGDELMLGA